MKNWLIGIAKYPGCQLLVLAPVGIGILIPGTTLASTNDFEKQHKMEDSILEKRHGVDMSDTSKTYIWHWGYGYETFPCEGKEAYCGYMDMYWRMHDLTMQYSFILWYVTTGILFATAALRFALKQNPGTKLAADAESGARRKTGTIYRGFRASSAFVRRRLGSQTYWRLSRLQFTLLALIAVYLTIFSFVGGQYKKIYHDGSKTRTFLGPWSNRVGVLAFALTPLTLVLSSRENIFSLITGIPYQHFNFLHVWIGRMILVQSLLHTIGWTVIQGRLYEPDTQPLYLATQWKERYYYMGFFAQIWIAVLWVGSLRSVIRKIGYEVFRKSHYLFALLFIGGCWGHWPEMQEWMIASVAVFFFDRFVRLLRTALIHFNLKSSTHGIGFRSVTATVESYTDADSQRVLILRLASTANCKPGRHTFLTFPSLSIFQAHPFTPALVTPSATPGMYDHVYLIVAMGGETKRLADLPDPTVRVILTGPYGNSVLDPGAESLLFVSGGTGVSFTLPLLHEAVKSAKAKTLRFVWVVRRAANVCWLEKELSAIIDEAGKKGLQLEVRIFLSRDEEGSSTEDLLAEKKDAGIVEKEVGLLGRAIFGRPEMREVATEFTGDARGRCQVLGSGPEEMERDLRSAVAEVNDAAAVWSGREEGDVSLYWDGRYH